MRNPYFGLFSRQWQRGRLDEEILSEAVGMGLISEEEKDEIMDLPQNK